MPPVTPKIFQLGITMSGAISAGAYTAGVLDYLIEALDAWEKQKAEGRPVPNHRIGIKVMSGASAGAITAAIGAFALCDGDQEPLLDSNGKIKAHLPKLYDSWVVKPTFVAEKPATTATEEVFDFLQIGDLDPGKNDPLDAFFRSPAIPCPKAQDEVPVASLLNVRVLAKIASDAITVKKVKTPPRSYIADPLHVYMTLTNLRGVPYKVSFGGGDYHMITHGDRIHYAVHGAGAWGLPCADYPEGDPEAESDFAKNDAFRDIDAAWLTEDRTAGVGKTHWVDFAVTALASSAFPVGLAPRLISVDLHQDYRGRRFPSETLVNRAVQAMPYPNFTDAAEEEIPFYFTSADGGIIDNDPFEYAHFAIKKQNQLELPVNSKPSEVKRAVIMISPFPEEKPILNRDEPGLDIISIVSALFPSLIDQARFKPDALFLAADPNHASRYLIGPSRVADDDDREQRYGIASGLLGGFGGFVSRKFRDHDYQLGRRNCQWFLRHFFALPEGHEIFESWEGLADKTPYRARLGSEGKTYYQLVPIGDDSDGQQKVELPKWPKISEADFETLKVRLAQRFDYVAPKLISQNVRGALGFLLNVTLWPIVRNTPGLIRDRALNYAYLTILEDLVRRDQIEGWGVPPNLGVADDDARLILGELLVPKFDQRNVKGILRAVGVVSKGALNEKNIESVLAKLKEASGPCRVWEAPWKDRDGASLFTLESRKPKLAANVFGGRVGMASTPIVDPPGFSGGFYGQAKDLVGKVKGWFGG